MLAMYDEIIHFVAEVTWRHLTEINEYHLAREQRHRLVEFVAPDSVLPRSVLRCHCLKMLSLVWSTMGLNVYPMFSKHNRRDTQ